MKVYTAMKIEREAKKLRQKRLAHPDANLSHNFVTRVTAHLLAACSDKKAEASWSALQYLLRSHYLYSRQFPELLTVLLGARKMDLVVDFLRGVHDVSEAQAVRTLLFLLGDDAASLQR